MQIDSNRAQALFENLQVAAITHEHGKSDNLDSGVWTMPNICGTTPCYLSADAPKSQGHDEEIAKLLEMAASMQSAIQFLKTQNQSTSSTAIHLPAPVRFSRANKKKIVAKDLAIS